MAAASQDTHVDGGCDSSEALFFASFGGLLECLAMPEAQSSCTGAGGAVVHDRLAAVSEPLSCWWRLSGEESSGRVRRSEDVAKISILHSHTHAQLQVRVKHIHIQALGGTRCICMFATCVEHCEHKQARLEM